VGGDFFKLLNVDTSTMCMEESDKDGEGTPTKKVCRRASWEAHERDRITNEIVPGTPPKKNEIQATREKKEKKVYLV